MGFSRNLEPFEIAGQVRELALLDPPIKPTNIVFMGMGEPLMNWPAVDVTLTILNEPQGFGIGARHITISTVGVLPGIVALSERPEQFRLAISIHAPSDSLRRSLMPINVKYPLADVIDAARRFDASRHVRVRDAGRRERRPRARDRVRRPGARLRRVREPDPAASGRHGQLHAVERRPRCGASRRSCAAPASKWRSGRVAASTSPRRAGSYGWNGFAGGRQSAPNSTVTSR